MELGKVILTRNTMAGSNTMVPSIIYTSNGATNLAVNQNAGMLTAQQTIPFNGLQYQTINVNGHAGLAGSTVLRPGGILRMQGNQNNVPIVLNSINGIQLAQTSNQNIIPSNQISAHNINGTLLTRHVNQAGVIPISQPSALGLQAPDGKRKYFLVKLPPKVEPKIEHQQQTHLAIAPTQQQTHLAIAPTQQQTHLAINSHHPIAAAPPPIPQPQFQPPIVPPVPQQAPRPQPEAIVVPDEPEDENDLVIDIMINNVVCSFSVSCHLELRNIALAGKNVEFRRENGMVTMKLRNPPTTASIWSSGKITCTGSTAEDQAQRAARKVSRCLQKLGYRVRMKNYRIVNVLGTCTMPFAIRISQFSQKYRKVASYEPELHPGVTYRIVTPKATLKIFSTGSITVTAPSVSNVQSAIEHIFPLVKEFSKPRSPQEVAEAKNMQTRTVEEEVTSVSD